ncbi:hypothetical protein [Paenibacillus sp. FSL R5-0928]|uniref:hypothetical protein n=1 Tax=Paenibacillus sp. FSL R5-0928 TaxID=2921667 RepID=UPI0030D9C019
MSESGKVSLPTPERIEEKKLKKGDRVVMHTCIESEEEPGKIWTCKSDQFTRGKGVFAQDSVFLEGYSGSFAPEFLQKVVLPSEDERMLAALEESQQQKKEDNIELVEWEERYTTLQRTYRELDISAGETLELLHETARSLAETQKRLRSETYHLKNANYLLERANKKLAESQKLIRDLKEEKSKIFAVHDEQCVRSSEYYNELIFVKGKLAEAQQTIVKIQKRIDEQVCWTGEDGKELAGDIEKIISTEGKS